jgi:hypothetical protein
MTQYVPGQTLSFAITGNNLLAAINALQSAPTEINNTTVYPYNGLSTNITNYHIVAVYYDPEVYIDAPNAATWTNGDGGVIGTSFRNLSVKKSSSLPLPFFRMYTPSDNRHFYTTSTELVGIAENKYGSELEGNAGQLYAEAYPGTSLIPLYWFWRSTDGDHCYTTTLSGDPSCGTEYGYVEEATAGYLPNHSNCKVNLYRVYSAAGGHFYTTSYAEAESAIAQYNGTLEDIYCIIP